MQFLPIAVLLLAATTLPALAQSEEEVMARIERIHGDSEGFGEIYGRLQDAFLFDDPTSIAELGIYPMAVNANGESYDILEAQDLVDNFDSLVSTQTQEALLNQDFADLLVTSEGVSFASGALWMTNICLDDACAETQWGIWSINN